MSIDLTTPSPALLAAALVAAQRAAVGVHKSSRNGFHKYDYASAEQIIWVATKALTGAGLALICAESEIIGDGQLYLRRRFVLCHEAGGERALSQVWPIVPEKGRPLDKAVAAADTAGLGYLLRSLLLLPRVERGTDLDEPRGDEPGAHGGQHKAPAPTQPQPDAAQWLGRLAHEVGAEPADLDALFKGAGRDYRTCPPDRRAAATRWARGQMGIAGRGK